MFTGSKKIEDRLNGPAEEAYRTLRTNINFYGIDKKIRTISITSTIPNEGKTTTSINLAISFAKSGQKVLFIDADLRKTMAVKDSIFQDTKGLSNYLSGLAVFEDIVRGTSIDNMSIISCGPKPPNPSELIGSSKFAECLEEAKNIFDIIIVDTPPLGSVIDGAIISALTDGTIIVVETNKIEYKKVQKVKEQLEKANARILGVVLNKMKKSEYKYYYNYYNYYGSTNKGKKSKEKQDLQIGM